GPLVVSGNVPRACRAAARTIRPRLETSSFLGGKRGLALRYVFFRICPPRASIARTNLRSITFTTMKRVISLSLLLIAAPLFAAEPPESIRPVGADGKPLNLDFETGNLRDWTATGDAFNGQPIKGDTVAPRRGDMKSEHQGQYW